MKKTILLVTILAAGLLLFGSVAQVSALPYELNTPFPGKPAPAGTGPWLTIDFTQNGTNEVLATLTADLAAGNFITGVYFNFTGTTAPTFGSGFTEISGAVYPVTPQYGDNAFKADGDGYFDILVSFATNNGGPRDKFDRTDSVSFLINGTGITPEMFIGTSLHSGGEGVWGAAAHVQGLDGGRSTWIGDGFVKVPEPSTMLLLGIGLIGLAGFSRKRIFSK